MWRDLAVAGLALIVGPASAQSPAFDASIEFVSGPQSGDVILADLNGDGTLDLVVQHLVAQQVAVHFGDGKGGLKSAARTTLSLAFEPAAIALGDVSGDGIPDLVIASHDRATKREDIHVFRGDGAAGFTPLLRREVMVSRGGYKPFLFVRDLDGDGRLDVGFLDARSPDLVILYTEASGDFTLSHVALETSFQYRTIGFADVDGDGALDLVVTSIASAREPDRISLREGDGRRGFGAPVTLTFPFGPSPHLLGFQDLNGDGGPDLILAHANSARLSVLLNDGQGSFVAVPGSPYLLGGEAWSLVVADVNRDTRADLLVATESSVSVLVGEAAGFVAAPGSPFVARRGAYRLAVGDINRDGKLDIVASSFEDATATPFFGR